MQEPAVSKDEIYKESDAAVPDGGFQAWTTIAGAWFVLFSTFGYCYSYGVYQDFYVREYLINCSPSKIAWIGSVQLALPMLFGIISGKLFDDGYFYALEIAGSAMTVFSTFMLSLAKPLMYYQIFLSQGLGVGIGLGLTFVPTISISNHYFHRRRALATGVAMSGICAGGTVFPIMLNLLIPRIGFAKAVRASGYLMLGCLVIGNALMRTRPLSTRHQKPSIAELRSFFVDPPYMIGIVGGICSSFGSYFPVVYLQLYATTHAVDNNLAFYSLAIINSTGLFGRVLANYLADIYGPYNIQVPATIITAATIFAVLGIHDKASLVVVSVLYGILSGAWLGLVASGLASLSRNANEVGARTGIALALISFGTLGSAPSQGALLGQGHDLNWVDPVAFSGTMVAVGGLLFGVTRQLQARKLGHQKV